MSIVSTLRYILKRSVTGGNPRLRSYEFESIGLYFGTLPDDEKDRLLKQFEKYDIVQRGGSRKIVQFFEVVDPTRRHWDESLMLKNFDYQYTKVDIVLYETSDHSKIKCQLHFAIGALVALNYKNIPINYISKFIKITQVSNELRKSMYKTEKLFKGDVHKPKEYFG